MFNLSLFMWLYTMRERLDSAFNTSFFITISKNRGLKHGQWRVEIIFHSQSCLKIKATLQVKQQRLWPMTYGLVWPWTQNKIEEYV